MALVPPNPSLAALAGSLVALLLVVAVGSAAAVLYARQRDEADRARQAAEKAEKEKTDRLWHSYLDQARAGRRSREAGQRFSSLEALRQAAAIRPDLALRNEAIACLALTDFRPAPPTGDSSLVRGRDTASGKSRLSRSAPSPGRSPAPRGIPWSSPPVSESRCAASPTRPGRSASSCTAPTASCSRCRRPTAPSTSGGCPKGGSSAVSTTTPASFTWNSTPQAPCC